MQFPFTFTFNIPGLHNPFLAASSGPAVPKSRIEGAALSHQVASLPSTRLSPINFLSSPVPLARKRGWVPSEPEPSHAAASATSTIGYLDTPAKYRDMPLREPEQDAGEMIAELPPAKRRRTLAGSIVSTALSAALIGTAVGLTVYRLWRDRGKQPEQLPPQQPPPPPYQRGDWVPDVPEPIDTTSPLKPRRPRPTPSSVRRPVGRLHRKSCPKWQIITPPRSVSPVHTSPRSELDYIHVRHYSDDVEPGADAEDQMDWMGDRLTRLIQEGQKALGREIVVMSEVKEDEVDDGSDAWEEEQDDRSGRLASSISRGGSIRSPRRTHKPRDIPLSPSFSPYPLSPPVSPRKRHLESESGHLSPRRSTHRGHTTPRRIALGTSAETDTFNSLVSSYKEDESMWESPELRESMERARVRYLQRGMQ